MLIIIILLLAAFQVTMVDYLANNPEYYQLNAYTWESDEFRSMQLGELLAAQDTLDYDMLTTLMIQYEYDLGNLESTQYTNDLIMKKKAIEYQKLRQGYEKIFTDLKFFPIPINNRIDVPDITYENGWLAPRTYGGDRSHEGCDLMGNQKERGYYPIISMSDGVIEKVGWLEKGGWRIGIRTPSGVYLYYAHLYSYSQPWQEGDQVKAGTLLGFMGDSGYSTIEGTVGNFDIHLHLGIYLKTDHYEELSINPYWILKYLDKKRLRYSY